MTPTKLLHTHRVNETDAKNIWDKWYPLVYGYFYKRVSNRHDVEELTANTVGSLVLNFSKIKSPHSYVWQTAKNQLYTFIKQKYTSPSFVELDENYNYNPYNHFDLNNPFEEDEFKPSQNYLNRINTLKEAIKCLKNQEYEILYKSIIENKNSTEIAFELGLKPDNVRQKIKRGIAKLKSGYLKIWNDDKVNGFSKTGMLIFWWWPFQTKSETNFITIELELSQSYQNSKKQSYFNFEKLHHNKLLNNTFDSNLIQNITNTLNTQVYNAISILNFAQVFILSTTLASLLFTFSLSTNHIPTNLTTQNPVYAKSNSYDRVSFESGYELVDKFKIETNSVNNIFKLKANKSDLVQNSNIKIKSQKHSTQSDLNSTVSDVSINPINPQDQSGLNSLSNQSEAASLADNSQNLVTNQLNQNLSYTNAVAISPSQLTTTTQNQSPTFSIQTGSPRNTSTNQNPTSSNVNTTTSNTNTNSTTNQNSNLNTSSNTGTSSTSTPSTQAPTTPTVSNLTRIQNATIQDFSFTSPGCVVDYYKLNLSTISMSDFSCLMRDSVTNRDVYVYTSCNFMNINYYACFDKSTVYATNIYNGNLTIVRKAFVPYHPNDPTNIIGNYNYSVVNYNILTGVVTDLEYIMYTIYVSNTACDPLKTNPTQIDLTKCYDQPLTTDPLLSTLMKNRLNYASTALVKYKII